MSEPRDCTCSAWIKRGEPMRIDSSHCPVHAVRQPASEPASELVALIRECLRDIFALPKESRWHSLTDADPFEALDKLAALAAARGDAA